MDPNQPGSGSVQGNDTSPKDSTPATDTDTNTNTAANTGTNTPKPREKKRVGFAHHHGSSPNFPSDTFSTASYRDKGKAPQIQVSDSSRAGPRSEGAAGSSTASNSYNSPIAATFPEGISEEDLSAEIHRAFGQPYVPKPKPAVPRDRPHTDIIAYDEIDKRRSGAPLKSALKMGSHSAPGSRRSSAELPTTALLETPARPQEPGESIPLIDLPRERPDYDTDDEANSIARTLKIPQEEADRLLKLHTGRADLFQQEASLLRSRPSTPIEERNVEEEYVPKPAKYRGGVLGALLKLYNNQAASESTLQGLGGQTGLGGPSGHKRFASTTTLGANSITGETPNHSPPQSGYSTPRRHWYSRSASQSTSAMDKLIESASMLGTQAHTDLGKEVEERLKATPRPQRPGMGKRTRSGENVKSALAKLAKANKEEEIKIKIHINGIVSRQRYLQKLCKALMQYGAPSHRLEEYLKMSARVLEIEGQFLYIPGCMLMSFDDSSTHTTEVKLVRTSQGVDLGKLRDTHEIYKNVVHDRISVEEGTRQLEETLKAKPRYNKWICIFMHGLASASVGPFAFEARWIDLPLCFVLGCITGTLQLVIAPRSDLYNNVFEIGAAIITSFLARVFGSINGGSLFCFSALAQSSIALILPGYMVLCASLELQSKHIVAGSVRMVYAIIYSLFLGFGITIGTVLYGLADKNATSSTTCNNPMSDRPDHLHFLFVPLFAFCLCIINQAKARQLPVMLVIAFAGYIVNYFSSQQFPGNLQISNTVGALAIGTLANLHARLERRINNAAMDVWENMLRPRWKAIQRRFKQKHVPSLSLKRTSSSSSTIVDPDEGFTPRMRRVGWGLAAASMLPAIFVQVPSGLAVGGSLVSGIQSADEITRNSTSTSTTTASATDNYTSVNSVALNVGFSVVQVAIGITVGLFLSAILVYPLGKKRSGLFSF